MKDAWIALIPGLIYCVCYAVAKARDVRRVCTEAEKFYLIERTTKKPDFSAWREKMERYEELQSR